MDANMDAQQTIIIGAGPAGLAVGACLKRAGVPAIILEQSDRVGSAWHRHYDRLHLHTARLFSELPFAHFPKGTPRYPSRLQVIDYLEAYARQFELTPRFNQRVVSARFDNGRWQVRTQDEHYEAANLVVACGRNQDPYCPVWPGQESFAGPILHSSQYRNGEPFRGQKVLVVGFGNSGGEIAIDLCEHGAHPALAVRSAVNVIPRELLGIPILAIGIAQGRLPPRVSDRLNAVILRFAIGDLRQYGLRKLPHGPRTQITRDARIPLIDVGTLRLIKQGHVAVRQGIERFTSDGVVFTDGRQEHYDAVVLATGYRPRVDAFLQGALGAYDGNGAPLVSGREAAPGLYFCGYYVSPTGMLREIALEARQIAASIVRKEQVPA
jgi:cation diffusion facilitator CzcD-associated flavoprotein CzcO